MVNFSPLKKYMYALLREIILKHNLHDPFLDVGCGVGDVSVFLGSLNWRGLGIDLSAEAIKEAELRNPYRHVSFGKMSLYSLRGKFSTVVCWDVLEHQKDDARFFLHLSGLVPENGHIVLSVPTKRAEWRWDDDLYGHYRRYEKGELQELSERSGLEIAEYWDFTFPVAWLLRRLYTSMKKPVVMNKAKEEKTMVSVLHSAWDMGGYEKVAEGFLDWKLLYFLQRPFRNADFGCETLVVMRKSGKS